MAEGWGFRFQGRLSLKKQRGLRRMPCGIERAQEKSCLGSLAKCPTMYARTWCTSAAEAPADVLELLHHVLRASSTRTANPGNCDLGFDFLASQVNKTALTRQDLLQALLACGFLPAEDDEEAVRRADDIFEFFIPGRQKFLSRREWCILDELWHEAQQQMQDLVRFAARKFDYSTNLIESWQRHSAHFGAMRARFGNAAPLKRVNASGTAPEPHCDGTTAATRTLWPVTGQVKDESTCQIKL